MGGHTSALGFPISDELTTPDGIGRYNVFEGGMIYWTPQHGAHPVSGPILLEWASSGYERGKYGYPVTDPIENTNGLEMEQKFEHGTLNGFTEVIQKIIDATPGAVGKLLPKEVYEDGIAYAKSIKQDVPIKVFEQALKDLLAYNEQYARENVSLQAGLPEGGETPIQLTPETAVIFSILTQPLPGLTMATTAYLLETQTQVILPRTTRLKLQDRSMLGPLQEKTIQMPVLNVVRTWKMMIHDAPPSPVCEIRSISQLTPLRKLVMKPLTGHSERPDRETEIQAQVTITILRSTKISKRTALTALLWFGPLTWPPPTG